MIDRVMMLLIKASKRGSYEKTKEGYLLELGEGHRCLVNLEGDSIEFNIKTIRWIPGSYEPIEGSEIYKIIMYREIETASDEEIMIMLNSIVNKIIG